MDLQILIKLLKSIVITILISVVFAYFLTFTGAPFVSSLLIFVALQFIFFYFYGDYVQRRNTKLTLQAELKLLEEKNYQSLNVVCPCDKAVDCVIPIKLNKQNQYVCPGCTKNIAVFISTKTALSTNPVSINPLEVQAVAESINQLKENK